MSSVWWVLLYAVLIMAWGWAWQRRHRNIGIVDVLWAKGVAAGALVLGGVTLAQRMLGDDFHRRAFNAVALQSSGRGEQGGLVDGRAVVGAAAWIGIVNLVLAVVVRAELLCSPYPFAI